MASLSIQTKSVTGQEKAQLLESPEGVMSFKEVQAILEKHPGHRVGTAHDIIITPSFLGNPKRPVRLIVKGPENIPGEDGWYFIDKTGNPIAKMAKKDDLVFWPELMYIHVDSPARLKENEERYFIFEGRYDINGRYKGGLYTPLNGSWFALTIPVLLVKDPVLQNPPSQTSTVMSAQDAASNPPITSASRFLEEAKGLIREK